MAKKKVAAKSNKSNTVDSIKFVDKWKWLIPVLAILLYANTLGHEYTQDDAIVIYDNMYTQQGVKGIPGLLKYDTFRGFFKEEGKAKLVSGGRYRPLTPIMFAIEYQIFGKNPFVGHLMNVLLYAFLGFLIFHVLSRMLTGPFDEDVATWIAFIAALLYVAHPIHTEAVANIKGRDEIMSMMGSIAAIGLGLKYLKESKLKYLVGIFVCFFLGLMSKETTITFLAVWPLAILLFRKGQWGASIKPWMAMFAGTILFLVIRTSVLGMDFGGTPMELMNNPYLKLEGSRYVPFTGAEKLATIFYTLGKYIWLLIFPHPLTHDYYPRHIDIMDFGNMGVIFSFVGYVALAFIAWKSWKKHPVVTFAIGFFIITLSIVSNIVFPIGTNMSERFMFMPSLGYTLLISYAMITWLRKYVSLKSLLGIVGVITLLYSVKTVTRNMVWKNDFTLFTTDVNTSTRSAKMLNAAGGALSTEAYDLPEGPKKTEMLNRAIGYLNKALEIHPGYKNAAMLLGNSHVYKREYPQAIQAYERGLTIAPGDVSMQKNLAVAYREAGKDAGEKENDLAKAIRYLNRSVSINDQDMETMRLLGVAYGISQNPSEAIKYFQIVADKLPNKRNFQNLSQAYKSNRNEAKAEEYAQKAATAPE